MAKHSLPALLVLLPNTLLQRPTRGVKRTNARQTHFAGTFTTLSKFQRALELTEPSNILSQDVQWVYLIGYGWTVTAFQCAATTAILSWTAAERLVPHPSSNSGGISSPSLPPPPSFTDIQP